MKGSIRFFAGLLITAAVAGGLDNAADGDLVWLLQFGIVGLSLMGWGVTAMRSVK